MLAIEPILLGAKQTILASQTQDSSEEEVSSFINFLMLEESTVNKTQETSNETQDILCYKSGKSCDSIYEETQELKKFGMVVEEFIRLEEKVIADFSFGKESRQISSDYHRMNIFVLEIFKDRVKHLETELLKKGVIINHLSSQLLSLVKLSSSKFSNSQNSENIDKVVNE